MATSHDLGQKGEELAAEFLKDAGYRILYRNWKWGKNEIDIVAELKGTIIFAEVKTRNGDCIEPPANAVTRGKQKSIIIAAEGYIRCFNINKESRFDILTVIRKNESFEVEHIIDAFYPTLR
jgi:putative endonuclease